METPIPVYCRECHKYDTWGRNPVRDIYGDNGVLLWENWRCTTPGCNNRTIRAVDNNTSYKTQSVDKPS